MDILQKRNRGAQIGLGDPSRSGELIALLVQRGVAQSQQAGPDLRR